MSSVTPITAASFPEAQVPPATFTLKEYEHMVECGAFSGEYEKHVELLWGRITEMEPIGPEHSNDVDKLNVWSVLATQGHHIRVRNQNPVRLPGSESEPHPDICWVREQDYAKQHPGPVDILLIIEVAHTSIKHDRATKLAAYAQADIQDYWIVNLVDKQVEVYRQPRGLEYAVQHILSGGDVVSPLALPDVSVSADELLAK